jgi:hypothetical protein
MQQKDLTKDETIKNLKIICFGANGISLWQGFYTIVISQLKDGPITIKETKSNRDRIISQDWG